LASFREGFQSDHAYSIEIVSISANVRCIATTTKEFPKMLKTITSLAAMTLLAVPAIAETPTNLTVTIDGIEQVSGKINLGLFDEAGYENGPAVNGGMIEVNGESVSITLQGVAPGTYGIKLYHDVNDNGAMDTNPFGMPTEPYAFSNNAKGRFGPASWAHASFEVNLDNTTHAINFKGGDN
jgi:uncharacterized protein (DUF2141 family)